MTSTELITLVVTVVCLLSFCTVFTILFGHYYKSNIEAVSQGKRDIALIDDAVEEEKDKKNKSKRAWQRTRKIASYVVLGAVFAIFACALVAKFNNDVMPFGDTGLVAIASGSMSQRNSEAVLTHPELTNQFDKYDIIGLTKYKSEDEVELYDVIAFRNDNGVTIIHRVVDIQVNSTGNKYFVTQGDSNDVTDVGVQYKGDLTFDRLIGRYNGFRLKGLGIIVFFLQSPSGIVSVLSVIYCLLMFDHYSGKYDEAVVKRTNLLVDLIDYDLEGGNPLESRYRECLVYRGATYSFEDGKYLGKEGNGIREDVLDHYMVFMKTDDTGTHITVTDTETNSSKTYELAPGEHLLSPEQYIALFQEGKPNEE